MHELYGRVDSTHLLIPEARAHMPKQEERGARREGGEEAEGRSYQICSQHVGQAGRQDPCLASACTGNQKYRRRVRGDRRNLRRVWFAEHASARGAGATDANARASARVRVLDSGGRCSVKAVLEASVRGHGLRNEGNGASSVRLRQRLGQRRGRCVCVCDMTRLTR